MWQFKKTISRHRREFMKAGDMEGYQNMIKVCQPKEQAYMQALQMYIFEKAGCPP